MKKYYISLVILGAFMGFYSKTNFWFQDARDIFFPVTKSQLKLKKNAPTPVSQAVVENTSAPVLSQNMAPTGASALEELSQFALFNELYNSKVLKQTANQAAYFEKIKTRLYTKYPAIIASEHKTAYEKEVADRLGLLRAMSHFWPTPKEVRYDHKIIKQFFYDVAQNKKENIMIRRQAYKNWLTFGDSVSQNEKGRFLASSDERLLHLVSLTDEDLIQSLTESAE